MRPDDDIVAMRAAHGRLLETAEGIDDRTVRQPSLLPDWTVGHVLTHLARNADSITRRLEGAARDEVVDQYPGGAASRAADIEAGAGRSAAALLDDVRQSNERVESACDLLSEDAWDRLGRDLYGNEQPVRVLPFRRWREVDVHHADLGLSFTPDDWPDVLVERWLTELLPHLPERTDPRALLAWTIGRAPAPELGAW